MNKLAQGSVAEFLGTAALTFFGAGAILATNQAIGGPGGGGGLVGVALAHALILACCVSGAMYISGGQFNPAVSIALALGGKQPPTQAAVFIIAQILGSASGAGMLVLLLGPQLVNNPELGTNVGATIGSLTTKGDTWAVFGLEATATFALMMVILSTAVDARAHKLGGFFIGLTVGACILAIGPLTGASMNPARTLGPAFYGHWDLHWVYWAAPTLGACLAMGVYRFAWAQAEPAKA